MKTYDAIVVGLGAMGSSTLYEIARTGASVLGLERASSTPHRYGSSVGHSRVVRKAYYEHPSYVPLLHRAYELWRERGDAIGEALLVRTGCLNLGLPEDELIRGVEAAVSMHGLAHERLDASAIRARFPAFTPKDDEVGIYEEDGALVRPERAIEVAMTLARRAGAEVSLDQRVTRVIPTESQCIIEANRTRIAARRVILAIGAWLDLPSTQGLGVPLGARLEVMRQVQHWFTPVAHSSHFDVGNFPCFIHVRNGRAFYGLPRHDGHGVKVCQHYGGAMVDPDTLDRDAIDPADEPNVRSFLRAYLPDADGALEERRVCMYGLSPDRHFVIGVHPRHPSLVVAGGFSGHGFKMSPVIGEALADLALRGETRHDLALFDPARFDCG